jgi:Outer membrane protein beta-barrel domain
MVTNFFKRILTFTMVTFYCGNIFAAETEISFGKMPTVEAKDEISGFQLKIRKGLDPSLSVSSSPDSTPDINHEFGGSLGYAINNLNSIGFMGSINADKFTSKDSDNVSSEITVAGAEGNATFAFYKFLVPYAGINLSRYYPTGENTNDVNYKAGFGFQAGIFGQVWKNIGYALSYQETKNSIKIELPDYPGVDVPGIKVKMKSLSLNFVVTI